MHVPDDIESPQIILFDGNVCVHLSFNQIKFAKQEEGFKCAPAPILRKQSFQRS